MSAHATIAALLFLTLLGCSTGDSARRTAPMPKEDRPPASWQASFDLRRAQGENAGDVFERLEDVVLVYRLNNGSDKPLHCRQAEGGPRVHFSISREGAPFADNLEGLMFTQAIVEFEVPPGITTFEGEPAGWEAFARGTPPPPATYVAHATPRFRCNGLALPSFDIPFRLVK